MTPKESRQLFDQFRARLWYQYVFSKCGWSDYRLDLTFGRDRDGRPRHAGNRSRIFGPIKTGRLPSRGGRYNRRYDLVELVDQHQLFKGSKDLFDSIFWHVISDVPKDVSQAHTLAEHCLERFGIVRLTGMLDTFWCFKAAGEQPDEQTLRAVIEDSPDRMLYLTALVRILNHVALPMDRIAIVGALFREAYLAGSLQIAAVLQKVVELEMRRFIASDWLHLSTGALNEDRLAEFHNLALYSITRFFVQEWPERYRDELDLADVACYPLHLATDPFIQEILTDPDSARKAAVDLSTAFYKRVAKAQSDTPERS